MTCKDCPRLVWFGDYALYYCDITKNIVQESDECSCPPEQKEKILTERALIEQIADWLCKVAGGNCNCGDGVCRCLKQAEYLVAHGVTIKKE